MHRIAIASAIALVGGLLLVAGPAVADDVRECADVGAAEACAVDDRRGDPGNETSSCQDYRAFTGANASHESDLGSYEAEAGGEETCKTNFFGGELRTERVFLQADGDGPAGETDALVQHRRRVSEHFESNDTNLRVQHRLDDNRTEVRVDHQEFGDRCFLRAIVFVDVEPYHYAAFAAGNCPEEASPSAPPNPGWGDVLP